MSETTGATIQGPRADYLCEKCHDAGKMPEPVELSVAAKFCPLCGKRKWLVRIWSPPRVSSEHGRSMIQASEKMGAAGFDDQNARKAAAWRNRNLHPHLPRIVSPNQLGQALAQATGGAFQGLPGLKPGTTTIESLRPVQREGGVARVFTGPRPGPGSYEHRAKITP